MIIAEPRFGPALTNWMFAAFFSLRDALNIHYVVPDAAPLPAKYIEEGYPGNKDTDELMLGFCGVCHANGMQCIPSDHSDCNDAAKMLGVETADNTPDWPFNLAEVYEKRAEDIDDLDYWEGYL